MDHPSANYYELLLYVLLYNYRIYSIILFLLAFKWGVIRKGS